MKFFKINYALLAFIHIFSFKNFVNQQKNNPDNKYTIKSGNLIIKNHFNIYI